MPYTQRSLKTHTHTGLSLRHTLIQQHDPDSQRVLIVFPGRGYTGEHPVLYYLRRAAADMGYDVLSVSYSLHTDPAHFATMNLGAEVRGAVEQLDLSRYRRVVFAGKSMGTPLALSYAQASTAPERRLILLTPISDVADSVGTVPTLAVIGTQDRYYDADFIHASRDNGANSGLIWRIFDGLDHSLESPNDWANSLAQLQKVIAACMEFLR